MIIEDKVTLKRKIKRTKSGKEYSTYFISFSIKYTPLLSKFEELHNVEIIAEDKKITIPKARLFVYTNYYRKSTGEKIKQFSITIPGVFAEELWNKGQRKLKVLVELPDLVVKA